MSNNIAGGASATNQLPVFAESMKSNRQIKPQQQHQQQYASPCSTSLKAKHLNTAGISHRFTPNARSMASQAASSASKPNNHHLRRSSNSSFSGKFGSQSFSSLNAAPQQNITTTLRAKNQLTARSPDVLAGKYNSNSSKQPTSKVAFETWIQSICPDAQSNTQRKSPNQADNPFSNSLTKSPQNPNSTKPSAGPLLPMANNINPDIFTRNLEMSCPEPEGTPISETEFLPRSHKFFEEYKSVGHQFRGSDLLRKDNFEMHEPPRYSELLNQHKTELKASNFASNDGALYLSSPDKTNPLTERQRVSTQYNHQPNQQSFESTTDDQNSTYAVSRHESKDTESKDTFSKLKRTSVDDITLQLDEFRLSQRRINASMAQSPQIKNSMAQRYATRNQDQIKTKGKNTPVASSFISSPAIHTMSASKTVSAQDNQFDIMDTVKPIVGQMTDRNIQQNSSYKQKSLIGSGVFNKRTSLDDVAVSTNREMKTNQQQHKSRTGSDSNQVYGGSRPTDEGKVNRDQLDQEEIEDTDKQRTDNLMGPYDFDKYEMISTSNQIQNLLSQKQDSPRGSSASPTSEKQDIQPSRFDHFSNEDATQTVKQKIMDRFMQQQQFGHSEEKNAISPEPKFKQLNSSLARQRSEKKVSATSQILKVNERIKHVQSPQTRNAQQMPFSTRTDIANPTRSTSNSFLGKAIESREKQQSPGKTIQKVGSLDYNMLQSKRSHVFQRSSSSSCIINGSPAKAPATTHKLTSAFTAAQQTQRPLQVSHKHTNSDLLAQSGQKNLKQDLPNTYPVVSSYNTCQPGTQTDQDRTVNQFSMMSKMSSDIGLHKTNGQLRIPDFSSQSNSPQCQLAQYKASQNTAESSKKVTAALEASDQSKKIPLRNSYREKVMEEELTNEAVLQFLLVEEEWLDQLQDLAGMGNFLEMQAKGLLLPHFDPELRCQTLYANLFSRVNIPKQRPRVFSMQLNMYVQMVALVTEILVHDQSIMRKFAFKVDDILKNCHQNFLLMIDILLSGITETAIKKSIDFKLLKTVITKKLDPTNALKNRLTTFRQKNELTRAFLKRIASDLTDMNVSKQIDAVQNLCSVVLQTLKLTIEEYSMDVTKNESNQKRIIVQLLKLYDQAIEASKAMKIASKKANIKKSQQHERKVKSVIRGQKVAPQQHQSTVTQKHVSPMSKRLRQQAPSVPSNLSKRIQGHLFNSSYEAQAQPQPQYLHTVEETEFTDASASKSYLLLESQPTDQSPPRALPEFQDSPSPKLDESLVTNAIDNSDFIDKELSPEQSSFSTAKKNIPKKRKSQAQEKVTKIVKRTNSMIQPANGDSSVKHTKANTGSMSKKHSVVSPSIQNPRSPSQRWASPMANQADQTKKLQSIVLQQHQQLQQSHSLQSNSLLPENIAFIMANSGITPTGNNNNSETASPQYNSSFTTANDVAFSINLKLVQNEQPKPPPEVASRKLNKTQSLSSIPNVEANTATAQKQHRFSHIEPQTSQQLAKTTKKSTLQKSKTTQIGSFQLAAAKKRLKANQAATNPDKKRQQKQVESNNQTAAKQSSQLPISPDKNPSTQSHKQARMVGTASSSLKKKRKEKNYTEKKQQPHKKELQVERESRVSFIEDANNTINTNGSEKSLKGSRGGELSSAQRSLISIDPEADANPFATIRSTEPEQVQEEEESQSEKDEPPYYRNQGEGEGFEERRPQVQGFEALSNKSPLKDKDEVECSQQQVPLESQTSETAFFFPKQVTDTSLRVEDQASSEEEDDGEDDDDLDEDGSLILDRPSEINQTSRTSNLSKKLTSPDDEAYCDSPDKKNFGDIKTQNYITEEISESQSTSKSKLMSQKDNWQPNETPFEQATDKDHAQTELASQLDSPEPKLSSFLTSDMQSKNHQLLSSFQNKNSQQEMQPYPYVQQSHQQEISPVKLRQKETEDEILFKFSAKNFITPKLETNLYQTASERPLEYTALNNDESLLQSQMTGKLTKDSVVQPKIVEMAEVEDLDKESDLRRALNEHNNGAMNDQVEDSMCSNMQGRRSSTRLNSLLFEEDSLQIKREMMRQKKEQQRLNREQRVSLKLTPGTTGSRRTTARRLTSHYVLPIPSSARNTVSKYRQTSASPSYSEVFGTASQYAKNQNDEAKSQSMIELDSMKGRSQFFKNQAQTEAERIEAISSLSMSNSTFEPTSAGISRKNLPLSSPLLAQPEVDQKWLGQNDVSAKQATEKASDTIDPKIDNHTPILAIAQVSSTSNNQVKKDIITPLGRPTELNQDGILTSESLNQPTVKASEKSAKSAADAAYNAFYQSLIPKQSSKEKEDNDANAFIVRSKSEVTSFLEIPDAITNNDDKDKACDPRNSYDFSNVGTFQTPERDPQAITSPNQHFRGDIIAEHSAEEDISPESPELHLPTMQSSVTRDPDSFQTNAFESIDSFVQLENQLASRGDSLVKDIANDIANQKPFSNTPQATAFCNSAAQEEDVVDDDDAEYSYQGMINEEIDEEQEAIEAELAYLRAQVTIPYLPPIDTTLIDESDCYTLVLDLDETLIHYECDDQDGDYYLIRPGAIHFLKELAMYYEIVIFTAAMPEYADKILDNLDVNGFLIKHRLYRQHTTPTEDYAIKDLHLLGRQLERTIIVDNLAENFQATTPNNGIWVESWYDDQSDTVLPRLQKFLVQLVVEQVPDVRKFLTQEIKDNIIYACLETTGPIPPLQEIRKHTKTSGVVSHFQ